MRRIGKLIAGVTLLWAAASAGQEVGRVLPPWSAGVLDIHQVNAAAGDCAFLILPDGTTMLIDAGATRPTTGRQVPMKPNASREPGEWIARYVRHMLAHQARPAIDYGCLTHFHSDHMGPVYDDSPVVASGAYKIAGFTEVGHRVPMRKVIDRGWPDYDWPRKLDDATMLNYRAFLKWNTEHKGMTVERFEPGRNDQIVLVRAPEKYPNFEVRNIAANATVWTGAGAETRYLYPTEGARPERPPENNCSIAFRMRYGKFDYFTGGDLTGAHVTGPAWRDVETPVAKAVGPVDVSVLNHHGYLDSQNAFFVSTLRPRVWINPVRDACHPGHSVYRRIMSRQLYPGPRDLFTTNFHPASRMVIVGENDPATSYQGHIVVRVAPGGNTYKVIILDDSAETFKVTAVYGPYESR